MPDDDAGPASWLADSGGGQEVVAGSVATEHGQGDTANCVYSAQPAVDADALDVAPFGFTGPTDDLQEQDFGARPISDRKVRKVARAMSKGASQTE